MKSRKISEFDISKIVLEETYKSAIWNSITLYFIAPKEWINDSYPEAESCEIGVEVPIDNMDLTHTLVMISPTKDGYDYDWNYIDLPDENIGHMIEIAKQAIRQEES